MQEMHCGSPYLIQGHRFARGTRNNNTVRVMKQPDTIGQRYLADTVDAKSSKAEETKQRMETIDRAIQINANDMWEYQDASGCF